jgi:hypothetical protein
VNVPPAKDCAATAAMAAPDGLNQQAQGAYQQALDELAPDKRSCGAKPTSRFKRWSDCKSPPTPEGHAQCRCRPQADHRDKAFLLSALPENQCRSRACASKGRARRHWFAPESRERSNSSRFGAAAWSTRWYDRRESLSPKEPEGQGWLQASVRSRRR